MSYWESRQAREMYEAMEDAEQAAREIADIYAKASRELNYKITQIYERYRDKFELDDDEALKLLNQLRNPWDLDELRQRLEGLKGADKKEILKELESPAYRARIERLENLQSEIDRMMRDVYSQEKKVSTDHYVDQYNQSYYREIYDLKKRTGLDFSFGYVDDKALNRILRTNWSGANYSQRIWGNTQGLADELKTQLALAYLTGKNESEIATEIAKKYSTGAANARRLVRTESAYISGQAQAAADEEAGLDKYRILATLDLRTSDICREMDGQVFAYKDMEVGVNYPPFHPYCRTTILSEIDDQDLSQLKRRSRDPVTGEVKTFPGDITYQKWYEKEVAHNPEALFAEQVEKHRGADLKQYERYVERLGKKKVGSIDDFREKKYKNPDEYENLKKLYRDTLNNGREMQQDITALQEELKIKELKGADPNDIRVVNRQYANSKAYHDAFEKLQYPKDLTENCYYEAKRILDAANGTDIEYSTVIDSRTGERILDKFGSQLKENRVGFSKAELEQIKNNKNPVIVMHNHSRNGRPSGADIIFYFKNKNISSSLILCHNGEIYELSNINRDIEIDKIYKGLYNSEVRKRLKLADNEPFPTDIAEHIKEECRIKATTRLYELNDRDKMFEVRLISHE